MISKNVPKTGEDIMNNASALFDSNLYKTNFVKKCATI